MTKTDIETYEFCKKDLDKIKEWKARLPFGVQNHGCGSGRPNIEYRLEAIHSEMYQAVAQAMNKAEQDIQSIIDVI